ncbi:hypothetical protein ACHAWF_016555, partial [Thalassiosira exigua]
YPPPPTSSGAKPSLPRSILHPSNGALPPVLPFARHCRFARPFRPFPGRRIGSAQFERNRHGAAQHRKRRRRRKLFGPLLLVLRVRLLRRRRLGRRVPPRPPRSLRPSPSPRGRLPPRTHPIFARHHPPGRLDGQPLHRLPIGVLPRGRSGRPLGSGVGRAIGSQDRTEDLSPRLRDGRASSVRSIARRISQRAMAGIVAARARSGHGRDDGGGRAGLRRRGGRGRRRGRRRRRGGRMLRPSPPVRAQSPYDRHGRGEATEHAAGARGLFGRGVQRGRAGIARGFGTGGAGAGRRWQKGGEERAEEGEKEEEEAGAAEAGGGGAEAATTARAAAATTAAAATATATATTAAAATTSTATTATTTTATKATAAATATTTTRAPHRGATSLPP